MGEDTLSAWRMPGVEGAAGVGGEALHAWRIPRPFRRNVALRDGYRCCFCGCRLSYRTLTLDHVVPKCLGGEDSWENLASACMRCNSRKGSLRVEELGKINMRLLQAPYAPTALQVRTCSLTHSGVPGVCPCSGRRLFEGRGLHCESR